MTRKPRTVFRPLDGLLLLDKPAGLSSNQALQHVRHLFRAEKGGHTGSLDPLATGLLPICFGEATKIAGLLLGSRKAYDTVAVLGTTTDTDDADGAVLRERPVPVLTAEDIEGALAPLKGAIRQRAPVYSALKQGGEPLYARARRGEVIEAPVRDVEVFAIELRKFSGHSVALHVECGSGTYIRSLVRDLGETLGCGAHVGTLRRLWVEPFAEPVMYTLEQLEALADQGEDALEACLVPLEDGLSGFPRVDVDATGVASFRHGQPAPCVAGGAGEVAVFGPDGACIGLGERRADGVWPRRVLLARAPR